MAKFWHFGEPNYDEIQAVITTVMQELELRNAQLSPRDLGRYIRLAYQLSRQSKSDGQRLTWGRHEIVEVENIQFVANNDDTNPVPRL